MRKKKILDNRKQLLIRYRMEETGKVSFVDPCCDEIPAPLFFKLMGAIANVEKEWNDKISQK